MKRSISLTMVLIMMLSCISGLVFIKPMKVDAAEHKNLAPILMGDSWKFDMTVTNSTNDALTPMELTILKLSDGRIVDECKFEQAWLKDQGISAIRSGESFSFTDGHPVVYYFNEMKYEFLLKDSNGKTVIETFDFQCDLAEEMTQKVSNCVDAKQEGEQWIFSMNIKNTTTDNLKTTNLVIYQLKDTKVVEYYTFDKEWLKEQKLSVIEAGKSAKFIDGHPFDYRFNVMKYVFTMEDKQGETVTKSFCFRCNVTQPDFSKSKVKNITTLRHSAKFNVKVADGVYWIPCVF